MATTSWQLSGDDFETYSSARLRPRLATNPPGQPTEGHRHAFGTVFPVERGRYGDLTLYGVNFAVINHCDTVRIAN